MDTNTNETQPGRYVRPLPEIQLLERPLASSTPKLPNITNDNHTASTSTRTEKENVKTENEKPTPETPKMLPPTKIPERVAQAIALKEKGLIRISIHRSGAFDTREMCMVMKNLKVAKIINEPGIRPNQNLIIAHVKTGGLQEEGQDTEQLNDTTEMNEDIFAHYDQSTQVEKHLLGGNRSIETQANGQDIDQELNTLEQTSKPYFKIPKLTLNQNPMPITIEKPTNLVFNKDAFKNYTTKTVPESVAIILSFGGKFSVPVYFKPDDFMKLKEVAYMVNEAFAHPQDIETIRENIDQHITNYKEKQYHQFGSEIRDYFTAALGETKQFFKENKDIVATQADKANAAILIDKDTYTNKIEQILSDKTTYTQLKISSNPAYQKINEKILDRLVEKGWLKRTEAFEAVRKETKIANMYALIKTHKKGNAPRPIVNTNNSPGYTAAKAITGILTRLCKDRTRYNVLNSKAAIERIKATRILPDMKARSYDAVSMFTNISVGAAMLAVRKRQDEMQLNMESIILILDVIRFVCVMNTEISFNDKCYKQVKGLRMGSSLSPILADLVMEDLLDKVFLKVNRPQLFIKYVDDIFTFTTDEEHEAILKALNEADEHLKFEDEVQDDNGKINYLDFTVINKPYNVKTIWYQKHIASGRFINFHTHHPKTVVWSTAVQFVITMISNSSGEYMEEITNRARHLLRINSYPEEYIDRIIITAQEKLFINLPSHSQNETTTSEQNDREEPTYVTGIPHVPHLTRKIQTQIETSALKPRDDDEYRTHLINIKVASQTTHKMSTETFNKYKRLTQGNEIPTINLEDDDNSKQQPKPKKKKSNQVTSYTQT